MAWNQKRPKFQLKNGLNQLFLNENGFWIITDTTGNKEIAQLDTGNTFDNPDVQTLNWNYGTIPLGNYLKVEAGFNQEKCKPQTEGTANIRDISGIIFIDKEFFDTLGENVRKGESSNKDLSNPLTQTPEKNDSKLPLYIGGGIAVLELLMGGVILFVIVRYPCCKLSTWMDSFV